MRGAATVAGAASRSPFASRGAAGTTSGGTTTGDAMTGGATTGEATTGEALSDDAAATAEPLSDVDVTGRGGLDGGFSAWRSTGASTVAA